MPGQHIVKRGENLSIIARNHGLSSWRRIYEAPENAEFRKKRPNPNLIQPGDELVIPDKVPGRAPLEPTGRHTFKLTAPEPLAPQIEFVFVREQDKRPIEGLNVEFQLPPNGEQKRLTTGPEGIIRFSAPDIEEGTVRVLTIRNPKINPEQVFDKFGGDFATGVSHEVPLPADPIKAQLPILLKSTARRPGLSESGQRADDLLFGDMDTSQIEALGIMFRLDPIDTAPAAQFFRVWRTMAADLFSTGELEDTIQRMIDRAQANTGVDFSDPVLTKAVRAHEQTVKLEKLIRERLAKALNQHRGDLSLVTQADVGLRDLDRPIYNTAADSINGLTMAINDTHGYDVEVFEYELNNGSYKGKFRIKLFDHFGLDAPDVQKKFGKLAGFRAWFILQHHQRFAFKPFITRVELDYDFSGTVN